MTATDRVCLREDQRYFFGMGFDYRRGEVSLTCDHHEKSSWASRVTKLATMKTISSQKLRYSLRPSKAVLDHERTLGRPRASKHQIHARCLFRQDDGTASSKGRRVQSTRTSNESGAQLLIRGRPLQYSVTQESEVITDR